MADLIQKRPPRRQRPALFRALRRCWLFCAFAVFLAGVSAEALRKIPQPQEFFSKALTTAMESGKLNVTSMFLLFTAAVILAAIIRFIFCLTDEMKKKG